MRLETRQPGTSTAFTDAVSGEAVLRIACDEEGVLLVAYRLFDRAGGLVAESELVSPEFGLAVHSSQGDLLLSLPAALGGQIRYCLYNSDGMLLTQSDGVSTKIYSQLRMESVGRAWTRTAPGVKRLKK
jgi:hypothetical protein